MVKQVEVELSQVAVVMGSQSDWETMQHCVQQLEALGITPMTQIVSAHRTPDLLFEFAETAEAKGYKIIIAGAGCAAHLPGMIAAKTHIPVLGVPMQSRALDGMDSLLSIVQMPAGVPVGSLAIGKAGAINAALLAAAILANENETVRSKLKAFRANQTQTVLNNMDLKNNTTEQ